ncbi:MAG: pirin family protein [Acidobacteria bacterium]|nr:pirin family protein [Acidobacteriota bacterium]
MGNFWSALDNNEAPGPDTRTGGKLMHGFQFWINLPAKNKKEDPAYLALQAQDLAVLPLAGDAGTLKLIAGEYDGQESKIPAYSKQFLFHIRLKPGKKIDLPAENSWEYAAFLPQQDLTINGQACHAGDLIGFDDGGSSIEFANTMEVEAEFLVFGGEKYTEPYVAHGPFVMSSRDDIQEAHNDYMNGKYGSIVYDS